MVTAVAGLPAIRTHFTDDTRYLFQVLVSSTSPVEANIALDLLSKSLPDKAVVAAVNVRETIRAIPATPFRMAVDEETLLRVGALRKDLALLKRETPDGYVVAVTTAGNLVLDLIVTIDDEKRFWTPVPARQDLVDPGIVPHLIESEHLLATIIDIIKAMGIVHNPTLYLSLDDWHLEYARETIESVDDLFRDTSAGP